MLGPLLGVVGFVILAGAIAYLWVRPVELPPMPPAPPDESGAVASLKSDVGTLKTQLASLDAREKSDVASLQSAIAAASQSGASESGASQSGASQSGASQAGAPQTKAAGSNAFGSNASGQGSPEASGSGAAAAAAAAAMAATDALHEQVAALSGRLDQIQSAETAQAKQTQALPSAADVTSLTSRVQAVAQQQSQETASVRQDLNGVQQQLTKLSDQSQTLSKNATALSQLTSKADRLSQILRAQAALRAGMPLGTIDNAPQALTRFATSGPPTEAALRVSFPEAAKAAEKAGEPTPDQGTFWHRVWLRMQGLVTVRQGDRVILGDPTGAILAHAQRLLDAGDLSGSLDALGKLTGPAAAAMAPWEARAKALLDAQQALAKMAAS